MQVNLENFRSKCRHKVLSERGIVLLHRARELGGVAEAIEQSAEDAISPLLRFPPLATFALILILRNCLLRNLEVDDLEKELTPRNQAVVTLLMLAKLEDYAIAVRFEH